MMIMLTTHLIGKKLIIQLKRKISIELILFKTGKIAIENSHHL
jgi:hypothetical protein